jgi:hypothetical protein
MSGCSSECMAHSAALHRTSINTTEMCENRHIEYSIVCWIHPANCTCVCRPRMTFSRDRMAHRSALAQVWAEYTSRGLLLLYDTTQCFHRAFAAWRSTTQYDEVSVARYCIGCVVWNSPFRCRKRRLEGTEGNRESARVEESM